MSEQVNRWAVADAQSIRFHRLWNVTTVAVCSGVRCAGFQPIQSLYLSMVRRMVGLSPRQDAMVEYSLS